MVGGDQTPTIPLGEVLFNMGATDPEHSNKVGAKSGATIEFVTVTDVVKLFAHCPISGVKVQVVVSKLLGAGDQIPVIPFKDVVGNGNKVSPKQIVETELKVGVNAAFTITVTVSLIEFPQELVKVRVNKIVPEAVNGNVKFVDNPLLLEKTPLKEVQLIPVCP